MGLGGSRSLRRGDCSRSPKGALAEYGSSLGHCWNGIGIGIELHRQNLY